MSAFEFSNLAESTEAAYTKHRFAGFQNREAAQWRNWTVGDNQQPTFKQLEKGVTSMLEEMPESQRRTEGWSEHLTGGSSNFIFGEVELAAFERSNSIKRPARGGERAPGSGPSGLRCNIRLRPATVTPSVAYPPTGRATLRGAALR